MKLNVKLLRKIQRHITEEPRRFVMSNWMRRGSPGAIITDFASQQPIPDCGTAACIGGWALLLSGEDYNSAIINTEGKATKILGIEGLEAPGRLFGVSQWGKFKKRFEKARRPETRAKIACERIDHYIATKGAK